MKRSTKAVSNETEPETKMSKSKMESKRRQRISHEFQLTRNIIDARRPNLNCKMEQGDILEQMRELFLSTEQRLKDCETQLAQMQQTFFAFYAQSFTQGFTIGKTFSQLEPYIKNQMPSINQEQLTPNQVCDQSFLLNLLLQQQQNSQHQTSEAEFTLSTNNDSTSTNNDSGFGFNNSP